MRRRSTRAGDWKSSSSISSIRPQHLVGLFGSSWVRKIPVGNVIAEVPHLMCGVFDVLANKPSTVKLVDLAVEVARSDPKFFGTGFDDRPR